MNEIKLKRGGREVTFRKVPNRFALRLKHGRAKDERELTARCGSTKAEVKHVDSVSEKMELFAVGDKELESTMDELRGVPTTEVVTHVYALDDTPGGAAIPTGTMTLQFKPDVSEERIEEMLGEFGLELLQELDFVPHGYTVRLGESSTENPLKIAAKLEARKEIEAAEPDLTFQLDLKHVPADTLYSQQWHLNNRGNGVGLTVGADVKAEAAWDITRGIRDIVVCVMDDGFDTGHPDFDAPGKIVAPRDFGQNDLEPSPVADDDNHGTACAGVAIAEENGSGVVGLAPGCAFMPIRTSGWISDNDIQTLFQYAIDNDADVVSCSWSAGAWNFPLSLKMSGIIHKAATQGRSNGKGCVILFAAGNEDRPLNGTKNGVTSVQGFAIHPDVIAVGASNSLDLRSSYSNYGAELTLCAPSSGSPGRRIVTTDRRGGKGYSSDDYADDFGGTSSATPLAAGLAALILSVRPDLISAEVRSIMTESADKIDQTNGQYDANGHSPLYGYGRINAEKALALATGGGEESLPEVLFVEHRVDKPIPDQAQVQDVIPFPLDVTAKAIEVGIDIRHTYRSDLRVVIESPGGQQVTLANRIGGGQEDLIATFRSSDDPAAFAGVVGQSAKGDWTLHIHDLAAEDEGMLAKWSLSVAY